MGDLSSEPSMEDILSSIKRIIAEEGDAPGAPRATKRPARTAAARPLHDPQPAAGDADAAPDEAMPEQDDGDAILELRESIEAAQRNAAARDGQARGDRDAMVSPRAAEASRDQLAALSRMIVRPDMPGSDTLEGMVREMLRPMLSSWLDANLPRIVEAMVAREIARISNRDG